MKGRQSKKGLVHVYTGDGKGKTTAALGLCLRAIGWGKKACVVQFIKGYPNIGEGHFAQASAECFVLKQFAQDKSLAIDESKVRSRADEAMAALGYAREAIDSGEYDVVVLDEVNNAMHHGLVSVPEVLSVIEGRPEGVEIVLTGRNAPAEIIEAADYVTEIRSIKHPMEKGVRARKGIDY
jgi:cob(I)alamin adenosyltransferase